MRRPKQVSAETEESAMKRAAILGALVILAGAGSVRAQYPVPQQVSYAMNAAERANLQLGHDWWRDIMQGGNVDIASHYMPADFISRNPNIAPGRDAFLDVLKKHPDLLQNRKMTVPEVQFAKNDYVFMMW